MTALVIWLSSMWRIIAPWSARFTIAPSIRGTLSSTHIPVDSASVAPVMLVRERFLIKPPELPQTFRPLVTASLTVNPSIFGAEPAPIERPIPYLQ